MESVKILGKQNQQQKKKTWTKMFLLYMFLLPQVNKMLLNES